MSNRNFLRYSSIKCPIDSIRFLSHSKNCSRPCLDGEINVENGVMIQSTFEHLKMNLLWKSLGYLVDNNVKNDLKRVTVQHPIDCNSESTKTDYLPIIIRQRKNGES